MKNDSYLYERKYHELREKTNARDKWEKFIGKERLEELCDNFNEIKEFVSENGKYIIDDNNDYKNYIEIYNIFKLQFYRKEKINDVKKWKSKLFGTIYIPFLKLAKYYANKKYNRILNEYFPKGIYESICIALEPIVSRTLVNEIQLCKDDLSGSNEKEQYTSYLKDYLCEENYIIELFDFYPILLRCMLEKLLDILQLYYELVTRWNNDIDSLKRTFDIVNDKIIKLKIVGDSHKHGKSTIRITLCNGEIIFYKARDLRIAEIYNTIYKRICEYEEISSGDYRIVSKSNYGWEKGVSYKPCCSRDELVRFYQRMGIHIFLNYMFDSQDLHYQNLIANGEYPFFVDLEVICSSLIKYNPESTAEEKARWIKESTILKNGILPLPIGEHNYFSALEGKGGIEIKWKAIRIKNKFTSNMKIESTKSITPKGYNLPYIGENVSNWKSYIKEMILGFCQAYKYVLLEKETIKNYIKDLNIRCLFMNTYNYSNILYLSYHPHFLRNGGDRQMILSKIYTCNKQFDQKKYNAIFRAEVGALLKNDIPYFYAKSNSTDLYIEDDEIIYKNFFNVNPESYLDARLCHMSYEDMNFQKQILETFVPNAFRKNWSECISGTRQLSSEKTKKDSIRQTCLKIAESIFNRCIQGKQGSDVTWLYTTDIGPCITDLYLYSGIAGIIIFFAAINKNEDFPQYRVFESYLIEKMISYTKLSTIVEPHTGAFCGEYSIIYMYLLLYRIKHEKKFLDYAKKHEEKILGSIFPDADVDLLYGNAGAILVYINMYKMIRDKKYLNRAEQVAEYLLSKSQTVDDKIYWEKTKRIEGLAHGNSGIALCFIRLYKITLKKKYLDIAIKCIYYEDTMYREAYQNWLDDEHYAKHYNRVAWCHGAGGIAIVLKEILPYCDGKTYSIIKSKLDKAVATIERKMKSGMKHLCLCHGIIGNYSILSNLKEDSEIYRSEIRAICSEIHELVIANEAPGFMNGLSGIGYALLKNNDVNSQLPNVLNIEI